jgi:hypothetical protein
MNKGKAMKKVTCLVGDYHKHNDVFINKIVSKSMLELEKHVKKMRLFHKKHDSLKESEKSKLKKIIRMKDRETSRHRQKLKAFTDKRKYWETTSKRYKFIFENV